MSEQDAKQKLFDRAVRGLAGQRWVQSTRTGSNSCMYRGPRSMKCAAGHLIDDDKYRPEWEGRGVAPIGALFGEILDAIGQSNDVEPTFAVYSLVDAMQREHDSANRPEQMRREFIAIADRFGLTWPADVDAGLEVANA